SLCLGLKPFLFHQQSWWLSLAQATQNKNPNPSPIEKRFGFSWFGASSDTAFFENHRSTICF
ncbi:hypothetical protein, partial [Faecalibacterium prausnitzii]|uniref:hypothetical protein n=1 Tax=Faecalibacterium prausnitzii TaxID=853 RepID=UPI0019D602E9